MCVCQFLKKWANVVFSLNIRTRTKNERTRSLLNIEKTLEEKNGNRVFIKLSPFN